MKNIVVLTKNKIKKIVEIIKTLLLFLEIRDKNNNGKKIELILYSYT
jgi:hypothetical protein